MIQKRLRYTLMRHALIVLIFALFVFYPVIAHADIVDNPVVESSKIWTIKFNKPVVFDKWINQAFKVTDPIGNPVNITLELGEDKRSILIKPPAPGYVGGQRYTLSIGGGGLRASTGEQLKETKFFHFSIAGDAATTKAVFSDPGLEQLVRKITGIKTGDIHINDLDRIDFLMGEYCNIKSLEGIQYFRNLTSVYLKGNDIMDVTPLTKTGKIKLIDLTGNEVEDISPLGGLSGLEYLYLDGNPIEDISALRSLTRLLGFSFMGCDNIAAAEVKLSEPRQTAAFKDPNFEGAVRAEMGRLRGDISLQDAEGLLHLVISDTNITSLEDLKYFKNLQYLEIRNCGITDITPISSLSGLTTLFLNNNRISDISSLGQLTNLKNLDLNGNPIKDISALYNLKNLDNIAVLDCFNLADAQKKLNSIVISDPILEAAIKKELGIAGREITQSDAESLGSLTVLNQGVQSLEGLQNFKNLTYIWIAHNKVRDVSPLKDLQNLKELDMAFNEIQDVSPLKDLNSLEKLFIQGNPILDFESLLGLRNLKSFYGFYIHDDVNKAIAASTKAKEIIAEIIKPGMTEFQKELAIHDYVVKNARYDIENFNAGTIPDDSYTPYGLLINKAGVCEAYATTMEILLNMAGIENQAIIGFINGIGHSWNIVKIDGDYYHLDATWDDPSYEPGSSLVSHEYFNATDDMMAKDHLWARDYYPECNSLKYNLEYMK